MRLRPSARLIAIALLADILVAGRLAAKPPAAVEGSEVSDVAATLRREVSRCWVPPPHAETGNWIVRVKLRFARDGSLEGEPEVISPPRDQMEERVVASVIRAIRRCTPIPRLSEYGRSHADWRETIINFKPDHGLR